MRPRLPRLLSVALSAASLLVASCVVSPQPEPPAIHIELLSIDSSGGSLSLKGAPGAVTIGGSSLGALDLDATSAEASVTVAGDGSFSMPLGGAPTDAYRLQATASGLRSDPVDVTTANGLMMPGPVTPADRPLAGCFVLDPELELGPIAPSTPAVVTMKNTCAGAVTVGGFKLRLGSAAFSVAPAGPITVPSQGTSSFTVTFSPQAGAPAEDVVFVDITAPVMGRLPLTVRGQAP